MKLTNSFLVSQNPNRTWAALNDLKQVGECLPGATVESVENDVIHGAVELRIGPIAMTYRGTVDVKRDDSQHLLILNARATDSRGGSRVSAEITAELKPEGDNTRVEVQTELDVTGKPAQFGTGVLTEVGNRVLKQFAQNLSEVVEAFSGDSTDQQPASAPVANTPSHSRETPDTAAQEERVGKAEALSVVDLISPNLNSSALRAVGLVGIGFALGWLIQRLAKRGSGIHRVILVEHGTDVLAKSAKDYLDRG